MSAFFAFLGRKLILFVVILIFVIVGVLTYFLYLHFTTPAGQAFDVSKFDQKTTNIVATGGVLTGQAGPNSKVLLLIKPGGVDTKIKSNLIGQWKFNLPNNLEQKNYSLTVITYSGEKLESAKTFPIRIEDPLVTNNALTTNNIAEKAEAQSQYTTVEFESKSGDLGSKDSFQFDHTISGFNRYLLVGVALRRNNTNVTSVSLGSQPLTHLGAANQGAQRVELWGLLRPNRGTSRITVNLSGKTDAVIVSSNFTGVNQTDPKGNFFSAKSTSSQPLVQVVNSAEDQVVVDMLSENNATSDPDSSQQLIDKRNSGQVTGGSSYKNGANPINMSWSLTKIGPRGLGPANVDWALAAISLKPATEPALMALGPEDADRVAGLQLMGQYIAKEVSTGEEVYVSREEFEREVCFYDRCTSDPAYDQFIEGIGNHSFEYFLALGAKLRENCYTGFEAMAPHYPDPDDKTIPIEIFRKDASGDLIYPSTYLFYNPYPNCIPQRGVGPLPPGATPTPAPTPGQNEIKRTITKEQLQSFVNIAANSYVLDKKDPFRDMVIATDGLFSSSTLFKLFAMTKGYSPTTNEEQKDLVINTAFAAFDIPFAKAAKSGIKVTQIGGKAIEGKALKTKNLNTNIGALRETVANGNRISRGAVEAVVAEELIESGTVTYPLSLFPRRFLSIFDISHASTFDTPDYLTQTYEWLGRNTRKLKDQIWIFRFQEEPVETRLYLGTNAVAVDQRKIETEAFLNANGETKLPRVLEDIGEAHWPSEMASDYPHGGLRTTIIPGGPITTGFGDNPDIPTRINLLEDISKIYDKTGRLSSRIAHEEPRAGNRLVYYPEGINYEGPTTGYFFENWFGPPINSTDTFNVTFKDEARGIIRKFFMGEEGVNLNASTQSYTIQSTDETKKIGKFLMNRIDEGKTLRQALDKYYSSYGKLFKAPIPNVAPVHKDAKEIFDKIIQPGIQSGKVEILTYSGLDEVSKDLFKKVDAQLTPTPNYKALTNYEVFKVLTEEEGLVYVIDDAYWNTINTTLSDGTKVIGTQLSGGTFQDVAFLKKSLFQTEEWKEALAHELTHTFHFDRDFIYDGEDELDKLLTLLFEIGTDDYIASLLNLNQIGHYALQNPGEANVLYQKLLVDYPGLRYYWNIFILTGQSQIFKDELLRITGKDILTWFRYDTKVEFTSIDINQANAALARKGGNPHPLIALQISKLLYLGDEEIQITGATSQVNPGDQTSISFAASDGGLFPDRLLADVALVPASDNSTPTLLNQMTPLPGGTNCKNNCTVTVPAGTPNGEYNWLVCSHYVKYTLVCARKPVTVGPSVVGMNIYLSMDEASWVNDCSTLSVRDLSEKNRHGKSCPVGTGPTGGVPGRVGNAGNFDGVNDFVQVDNPALPTKDFSYSAWVRLNVNNDETILMSPDGAGGYELQLYVDPQGRLIVVTNNSIRITSNTTIPLNKWTHIMVTRSGSSIRAYFNGVADSVTGIDGGELNFGSCGLLIGVNADSGCNGGLAHHLNGKIDEVRVHNYPFTAQQVLDLYKDAPTFASSVTIMGETKTITDFQANPFNIHLPGTVGTSQSFTVPVTINYIDQTSKTLNWTFNYNPNATPPIDWIFCANENQTCSFSGTRTVRYGANNTYVTKVATGSIGCNNGVFGDPLPQVLKHCDYSNSLSSTPTPTPTSTPTPNPTPTPKPCKGNNCATPTPSPTPTPSSTPSPTPAPTPAPGDEGIYCEDAYYCHAGVASHYIAYYSWNGSSCVYVGDSGVYWGSGCTCTDGLPGCWFGASLVQSRIPTWSCTTNIYQKLQCAPR